MPNRFIREGLIDSERVNALSDAGECFFHRLLLAVDDAGRYDGRAEMLRARLFPLRDRRIKDVEEQLKACASARLIKLYDVDGKAFLQVMKWWKQGSTKRSKWPAPDGSFEIRLVEVETRDGKAEFVAESVEIAPPAKPLETPSLPGLATNNELRRTKDDPPQGPQGQRGELDSQEESWEAFKGAWNARLKPALGSGGGSEEFRKFVEGSKQGPLLDAVKELGEMSVNAKRQGIFAPSYSLADLEDAYKQALKSPKWVKPPKSQESGSTQPPAAHCPLCQDSGLVYVVASRKTPEIIQTETAPLVRRDVIYPLRAPMVAQSLCCCPAGNMHPAAMEASDKIGVQDYYSFGRDMQAAEKHAAECMAAYKVKKGDK